MSKVRSHRNRRVMVVLIGLVTALVLAACSSPTPSTQTSTGAATVKDLVWGVADSPRSLFAPTNFSTSGTTIMSLIQGQLLTFGPNGELQPGVAESWKATSPTVYEYTIRTDLKFSDGAALTAEDVAYSLNLHLDPKVASQEASLMSSVDSVKASGDVVTVTLKRANTLWQYLPAGIVGYVWQKSSVEADLSTYGTPQTLPIGSGPYMVSEFVPDSRVVLERNPNYTGDQPQFDKITLQVIPDEQTRFLAMQSGQIDGTFDVPATGFEQWKAAASVQTIPALVWRGLTLDMDQAPFNDIHVRRALAYATDREGIAQGLTPGLGRAATTINDPSVFSSALDQATIDASYAKLPAYSYDIDKAKAELAQSSVPDGFETTMNVPSDSATAVKIGQVLVENWAKIGVKLTLNPMPGGPRFQIILDHKPDLGVQIIGNVPDAPDPMELIEQYFSSAQAAKNGNNSSNFRDAGIDKLIEQAQADTDPKSAATTALQIQEMAAEQVPVIPILWGDAAMAVKQGWSADPPGAFYSTSLWLNLIKTS